MAGADRDQVEQLRMHGDQVDAERPVGERAGGVDLLAQRSGIMEPQAMTPKPPALEMAATRLRSDTQVIAPPRMA
jgi:hypothetical protein